MNFLRRNSGPAIKTFACFLFASFALSGIARSATITNFSETPTSLSYNFSGFGLGDNIVPALTNWEFRGASGLQDQQLGKYNYALVIAYPGDPAVFSTFAGPDVPYGTTITDSRTFGLTSFTMTITVQEGPNNGWGAFSGSFSASRDVNRVPDAGSSVLFLALGMTGLGALRRVFRR
jgi:hypothetical protein